jgi:hypothetical protein
MNLDRLMSWEPHPSLQTGGSYAADAAMTIPEHFESVTNRLPRLGWAGAAYEGAQTSAMVNTMTAGVAAGQLDALNMAMREAGEAGRAANLSLREAVHQTTGLGFEVKDSGGGLSVSDPADTVYPDEATRQLRQELAESQARWIGHNLTRFHATLATGAQSIRTAAAALQTQRFHDGSGSIHDGHDQGHVTMMDNHHTSTDDLEDLLKKVPVAPLGPIDGYDRSCDAGHGCSFGEPWHDPARPGVNVRQEILKRDMDSVVTNAHGRVQSGHMVDPYTKVELTDPKDIQIDHVVPLSVAWMSGANHWTQAQREAYANDPDVLWAVSGEANQAKGRMTPGQWMPPNRDIWPEYCERYLRICDKYHLPITPEDHAVIQSVIDGQDNQVPNDWYPPGVPQHGGHFPYWQEPLPGRPAPGEPFNTPDHPWSSNQWEYEHGGSNINPGVQLDPSTTSIAPPVQPGDGWRSGGPDHGDMGGGGRYFASGFEHAPAPLDPIIENPHHPGPNPIVGPPPPTLHPNVTGTKTIPDQILDYSTDVVVGTAEVAGGVAAEVGGGGLLPETGGGTLPLIIGGAAGIADGARRVEDGLDGIRHTDGAGK